MTVVLATAAGVYAARLHGFDRVEAANIGFTVLTRGEFSIILASLAVAAGLDQRIGNLAAGYVLVLAVVGPVMSTQSERFSRLIPRAAVGSPAAPRHGRARLRRRLRVALQAGDRAHPGDGQPGSQLHGVYAGELRLPDGSTLALLARAGETFTLEPATQLRTHDVVLVFTRPEQRAAAEQRIMAVHRAGRLATWRGDVGQ